MDGTWIRIFRQLCWHFKLVLHFWSSLYLQIPEKVWFIEVPIFVAGSNKLIHPAESGRCQQRNTSCGIDQEAKGFCVDSDQPFKMRLQDAVDGVGLAERVVCCHDECFRCKMAINEVMYQLAVEAVDRVEVNLSQGPPGIVRTGCVDGRRS